MPILNGAPIGVDALLTGAITANSQSVNTTWDVSKYGNVLAYCTGTFSTVNVTFEGSIDGGTSWFSVNAVRTNGAAVEGTTGNLSAAPAYAWEFSVNSLTHLRFRSTAWTSGTQTWTLAPGFLATEPAPVVSVLGTVTSTVSGTATVTPFTPTVYVVETTASTNAASIKGSAGAIFAIVCSNPTATAAYVKLYQKATAPTVGTDTPTVTIAVPAGSTVAPELGPVGLRFGTGLAIAVTAAAVKTDTGVAVAGVQIHAAYL